MSFFFFSFFLWLNLLSLDVVLIALAWQEVFARTAGVVLKSEERAVLAITIWMVYIVDHFLDSAMVNGFSNKAPRHHYVKSHRRLLGGLLMLAAIANIWLLTCLSLNLLIAGILLGGITINYLALNHFFLQRGNWLKGREVVVSIIFSTGCALVALIEGHRSWMLFPWIIVFSVIALINCMLIARMERKVSLFELAPPSIFFSRKVLGIALAIGIVSFFSPMIGSALCWSLMGLTLIPMVAQHLGYEAASLAADQVLFFAALLALLR